MIGQTISNYHILRKLGEGGMGVVYLAEDVRLQRKVALKFLPQHLLSHETEHARFLQEARAASALNHPNVCVIYDIHEQGGQPFLSMEYVEGSTLREVIARGPLSDEEVGAYAIQIADALQVAHSQGVIHRDIKSDNIMVTPGGQIKVLDFGLAKLKGSVKLTQTSSTVGTLAYMAPEQIQSGVADARSDIFSFGVVLYEMLAGRLPFTGEREAAMMYSILNEEPGPVQRYRPGISSGLLHVLDRALEKDPEDRYQTAHDMLIDLRRLKKETTRVSRKSLPQMPVAGEAAGPPAASAVPSIGDSAAPPALPVGDSAVPAQSAQPAARGDRRRGVAPAIRGVVLLLGVAALAWRLFSASPPHLNPAMTFHTLQVPPAGISYPGMSPDGNWIAFPAADERGHWDVYYMNASGGEARRITADSSDVVEQVDISPDGSQIAYDVVESSMSPVRLVSALGGASKLVVPDGTEPRWRPDGRRIGFIMGARNIPTQSGKLEFWSSEADGRDSRREFADTAGQMGGHFSFSWSPDGKSVAWIRTYPGAWQEVIVRDLASGRERQITHDRRVIDEVCWSRQNQIFYSSNRSGNTNLWLVKAGGGPAVQVTKGSGPDIGMKVSADGKRMVYLQQQAFNRLWAASLDGSGAHELVHEDLRLRAVAPSPDGRHLLVIIMDPDPLQATSHVFEMSADGTGMRQLTSGDEDCREIQWSPDNRSIAYRARPISQPEDSARIFVMDAEAGGAPRVLGAGQNIQWLLPDTLIAQRGVAQWMLPLHGPATRYSKDSILALPLPGGRGRVYLDLHARQAGIWIEPTGQAPRRLAQNASFVGAPRDLSFFVLRKEDGLWKLHLPDGRMEKLPVRFPGFSSRSATRVSADGKQIYYTTVTPRAKLVVIDNLR